MINQNDENNTNPQETQTPEIPPIEDPINLSNTTVNMAVPKKRKAPIIIGSVVGVVAVAGIAAAAVLHFNPTVRDWFERKTSEPDDYFASKEQDYISDNVNSLTEQLDKANTIYDSLDLTAFDFDNLEIPAGAYNISLGFSFDSDALVLLANDAAAISGDESYIDATTTDGDVAAALEILKSFKSISIDSTVKSDGNGVLATTASLELNDSSILDADLIIDTKEKSLYLAVPTISDKYIKYTLSEEEISYIEDAIRDSASSDEYQEFISQMELSAEFANSLSENLADIITQYYNIIIDNIKDDVDIDEDSSVEIANEKFTVTEMSATLNEDDLIKIMQDVLEEAKNDPNILSIVDSLGLTNEYTEYIDEAINVFNTASASEANVSVKFTAWTDKKGNIIGHKLSSNGVEIGYATIEYNDNTYSSVWMKEGSESVAYNITAKGKDKSEGTISFDVNMDGEYASINCDYSDYEVVDEEKGLVNFDAKITASASNIDNSASDFLKKIAINITSECSDSLQKLTLSAIYDGKDVFSCAISAAEINDIVITIPSDSNVISLTSSSTSSELQAALTVYLESMNFIPLKDSLKNALNNTALSEVIDTLFSSSGLDSIDGTQSAEDVMALIDALSGSDDATEYYGYDNDYDYDYDYDYDNDYGNDYGYDY